MVWEVKPKWKPKSTVLGLMPLKGVFMWHLVKELKILYYMAGVREGSPGMLGDVVIQLWTIK